jgi:hypothetical protein
VNRLRDFWRAFARHERVSAEASVLSNPWLPIFEVNAAYSEASPAHPIWIAQTATAPAGWRLERKFSLLHVPKQESALESVWVEQVPWSRAAALAAVWCAVNGAEDWLSEVSKELARVLQTRRDLMAFLAFEGDTATGMMIVSSSSVASSVSSNGYCGLWAGSERARAALFVRGAQNFERFEITAQETQLERLRRPPVTELAQGYVWINPAAV